MIKAVIIEDEEANRILLEVMLKDYIPDVEILGMASSVTDAIDLIQKTKPDIVFLDIEIKGGSGFDVLENLSDSNILVVFTTAYKQYAIQAIKNKAFDYLLKPILLNDVKNAIENAKTVIADKNLLNTIKSKNSTPSNTNKIVLKDTNLHKVVTINEIIMIKAESNYSCFYFTDGDKVLISKTLKQIERDFPNIFFRIHKSYLINLDHALHWEIVRGGNLTLINNIIVPISYRKKSEFLIAIQSKLDNKD